VLIDFESIGRTRADLMRTLAARGIGTQVHYIPVNRQPYYRHRYGEIVLPGAEAYYRRVLSLPFFVGMAESDVDRVVATLVDYFSHL
jgi:dTDP-4-amino-4,6-dideoxygalactose transaminase